MNMDNQNFNNSNANTAWNNENNLTTSNNDEFNNQQVNVGTNMDSQPINIGSNQDNNVIPTETNIDAQPINISSNQDSNVIPSETNIDAQPINISSNQDSNVIPSETNQPININDNQNNNGAQKNINPKNKKIILIAVIAVVAIAGIFGIIKLFSNSSLGAGKTVGTGEKMKINELDGQFNFSIEILSPVEKKHIIKKEEYKMYDDEYDAYAIKIKVENYGDNELNLGSSLLAYQILDSDDNDIKRLSYNAFDFVDAIQNNIPSGSSATGYLYFYDYNNSSEIDVNKAAKLEIGVLHMNTKSDNDTVVGKYNSYFMDLK